MLLPVLGSEQAEARLLTWLRLGTSGSSDGYLIVALPVFLQFLLHKLQDVYKQDHVCRAAHFSSILV